MFDAFKLNFNFLAHKEITKSIKVWRFYKRNEAPNSTHTHTHKMEMHINLHRKSHVDMHTQTQAYVKFMQCVTFFLLEPIENLPTDMNAERVAVKLLFYYGWLGCGVYSTEKRYDKMILAMISCFISF